MREKEREENLAGSEKTIVARRKLNGLASLGQQDDIAQDAQKVRPARPQANRNQRRYRPHSVGPFARTMNLGERKNPSSTSDL